MKKHKNKPMEEEVVTETIQSEGPAECEQGEPKGRVLTPEDEARIEKALKEREEYLQLAQRVQADFDNYRRRNASAVADAVRDGVCEVITASLSTLDNLDRALAASEDAANPMHKGVEMVRAGFLQALGKFGLEEIPALGLPFDPGQHNAVMQSQAAEGQRDGDILEVFSKGYRVKDKIIRYAMVRVAKAE